MTDDVELGYVVDLTLGEPSGTELVADAAIGATTLTVDYAGDFEDVGEVVLNGTTLAYTAIAYGDAETDPDIITLAVPLAAAAVTDDKVIRVSGGEPLSDWLLHVSLGDGHPVDIPIPFEQRSLWSSVDTSMPVPVMVSADLERLVEVPGRTPQIDSSFIDPTSTIPGGQAFSLDAPTATDGYPENYGWWQVDAAGNVLGFWRLVGGVWTAQIIVTAEALKVGNILADAINATDMSAVTVTGATVRTSSIDDQGIHLDSKGLRAYGPAGGSPFLDVDPAKGLVIVAGEGTFDKLTTPGELPVGETSAELGGLTQIKSGGKVTLVGGALPPAKAPTLGYTYDTTQFTDDGKWADRYGWSTDGTYWYTVRNTVGNFKVEKWSSAGSLVDSSDLFVDSSLTGAPSVEAAGCVYSGGSLYVLSEWKRAVTGFTTTLWYVFRYNSALVYQNSGQWNHLDGAKTPTIGVDAGTGDLLIAQARPSDTTIPNRVRIRRYAMPAADEDPLVAGASVDTDFAYNNDLAGVTYGTHDFGANRYVFTTRSGENTYRVVNSSGDAVAAENWQAPARRMGFAYTGGVFKTADWTGTMRTFTGLEKTIAIGDANLTKWVASTNYRDVRTVAVTITSGSTTITYSSGVLTAADVGAGISGTGIPPGTTIATVGTTSGTISSAATAPGTTATVTWETPRSPRASITISKRSKLTVTTAALPVTPGTNDPNQVQVYVGQGSSNPSRTNMWRQTTPAVGVITATYTSLVTTGTNPPAANNFPAATQAILEATTGGFTVDAASNGSIGTGTLRDSVRSAVMGDYAAGAWTTYTPTFTANTTNPTLGNFTRVGRYTQRGKTVTFFIQITCTSTTGLGSGNYQFGLPTPTRALGEIAPTGSQEAPNHFYIGRQGTDTSAFALFLTTTEAAMTSTTSGMTNGTILRITGTYEAA